MPFARGSLPFLPWYQGMLGVLVDAGPHGCSRATASPLLPAAGRGGCLPSLNALKTLYWGSLWQIKEVSVKRE